MIPPKKSSAVPLAVPSRPHMTLTRLRRAGLFGLMALGAVAASPHFSSAHAAEDSAARTAIFNHPNVVQLRSEVCQYFAQVDIARANKQPQVSLRVHGGSSIADHFERRETTSRRFDDRQVDAVIGLRQNLYDWGVTDRSIKIAEANRRIARIDVTIETDRQAADLLSLIMRYRELEEHRLLYENLLADLEDIAARIEAGVNAGALTLTDLREIKISNLDIEFAHLQVRREIDILKADLGDRYKLTVQQALPFLIMYERLAPAVLPTVNSKDVMEVRKLDLQKQVSDFEIERLNAQRKPALSALLDTHIYDVDGHSGEYELVGRFELTMPLYDGGSNKASRRGAEWQGRAVLGERSGVIRNYDAQSKQILQTIDRLDRNIMNTAEKIAAIEGQLDAHLAHEGQTVSAPLTKASLMVQLNQQLVDQISQQNERDREFVRGLFFADALGSVLNFSDEGTTC